MEMEQKCCPILLMSKKVKAIVPRISKPCAFLLQRAIVPLEATSVASKPDPLPIKTRRPFITAITNY